MKPEDYLVAASYRFEEEEMEKIVRQYFLKYLHRDIDFHFGYDDEDYQGAVFVDEEDESISDEEWESMLQTVPNLTDGYTLLEDILSKFMDATVNIVHTYTASYNRIKNRWTYRFYVEVNAKDYVQHVNLSEWGF